MLLEFTLTQTNPSLTACQACGVRFVFSWTNETPLSRRSVRMELQLRAATEFINSFSVSNSCECHTCRAMRKYNETIKQLEQQ